jgi:hypothetical protein
MEEKTLFGYSGSQIATMQGGTMRDAGMFPGMPRTQDEIELRSKRVEQDNVSRTNALGCLAGKDHRFPLLLNAGMEAICLFQAAKELEDGDDSLLNDLLRIARYINVTQETDT